MKDSELKIGMKVRLNKRGIEIFKDFDDFDIHEITDIIERNLQPQPQPIEGCYYYVRTNRNILGIWAALLDEVKEVEKKEEKSPIKLEIIEK